MWPFSNREKMSFPYRKAWEEMCRGHRPINGPCSISSLSLFSGRWDTPKGHLASFPSHERTRGKTIGLDAYMPSYWWQQQNGETRLKYWKKSERPASSSIGKNKNRKKQKLNSRYIFIFLSLYSTLENWLLLANGFLHLKLKGYAIEL